MVLSRAKTQKPINLAAKPRDESFRLCLGTQHPPCSPAQVGSGILPPGQWMEEVLPTLTYPFRLLGFKSSCTVPEKATDQLRCPVGQLAGFARWKQKSARHLLTGNNAGSSSEGNCVRHMSQAIASLLFLFHARDPAKTTTTTASSCLVNLT
ncbi:uncharacterized protein BP01DRAFT_355526 [Aspergillus saccharolyticus JOP 1030-1]|uniref:Uncharacterized protein n=1 Tax=Aspergillus saccharolyticus JOP 1030-1 TaxID=1450539 RepID=A0A318ZJF5_9EURO|nr:hypothetical protein BP01DRAFT_355526 [Aspergillus saccharolyticus JOP 1030-1]PYH46514.1 hypothetical protein BP01DRAFT_355526 [Aspergillus saccharolyticus JOP 1030-1]